MVEVVFHNLKKSEILTNIIQDRLEAFTEKFPDLKRHHVVATVSMDNSPRQAGADLFGIRVFINGRTFHNLAFEKKSIQIYEALGSICDGLTERLAKFTSKIRVRNRHEARRQARRFRYSPLV